MKIGNESAFPTSIESVQHGASIGDIAGGLTKREFFAAMAMQGIKASLASDSSVAAINRKCDQLHLSPSEIIARMAVADADALLAVLEETGK